MKSNCRTCSDFWLCYQWKVEAATDKAECEKYKPVTLVIDPVPIADQVNLLESVASLLVDKSPETAEIKEGENSL